MRNQIAAIIVCVVFAGVLGRAGSQAPAPPAAPPPLGPDAPFTVGVNTSTIEAAPVYVADEGPAGARFDVINGNVRNLATGSVHAATNAETQMLLASTSNPKI